MQIECNSPGRKVLRPNGYGPILAMPDGLAHALDFSDSDLFDALKSAADALARFEVAGGPVPPTDAIMAKLDAAISQVGARAAAKPAKLIDPNFALYDAAFSVTRTTDAAAGLVHGLLVGTKALLRQLGHANSLMMGARKVLVVGLTLALAGLSPHAAVLPTFAKNPATVALPHADPLDRWVEGHHVLFTMCQVAEYCFHRLNEARNSGNDALTREMLGAATSAFDFIGYAFALAGDISPADYKCIVDQMIAVDPKFTGLWFADHKLAKKLAKGTLEGCPMKLGTANLASFQASFNFASECHWFVCDEKAEKDRASLLQSNAANAISGPDSLRHYAKLNLRAIGAELE